MTRTGLTRDPGDWARSCGWINRKQADELRDALRECVDYIVSDLEGIDDFTPECLTNARRVLNKRVHKYPLPRKGSTS